MVFQPTPPQVQAAQGPAVPGHALGQSLAQIQVTPGTDFKGRQPVLDPLGPHFLDALGRPQGARHLLGRATNLEHDDRRVGGQLGHLAIFGTPTDSKVWIKPHRAPGQTKLGP